MVSFTDFTEVVNDDCVVTMVILMDRIRKQNADVIKEAVQERGQAYTVSDDGSYTNSARIGSALLPPKSTKYENAQTSNIPQDALQNRQMSKINSHWCS